MYNNIFKYDVDNLKDIFFNFDFFSFSFSFMHSVEILYLFPLLSILAFSIIMLKPFSIIKLKPFKVTEADKEAFVTWEPEGVPKERRNDLLYLKLANQYQKNKTTIKQESVYSFRNPSGKLDDHEQTRMHNAALAADSTGELLTYGYSITRRIVGNSVPLRIVYADLTVKTKNARSEPKFIALISKYDVEKGS